FTHYTCLNVTSLNWRLLWWQKETHCHWIIYLIVSYTHFFTSIREKSHMMSIIGSSGNELSQSAKRMVLNCLRRIAVSSFWKIYPRTNRRNTSITLNSNLRLLAIPSD